jgi:hypothetical protein
MRSRFIWSAEGATRATTRTSRNETRCSAAMPPPRSRRDSRGATHSPTSRSCRMRRRESRDSAPGNQEAPVRPDTRASVSSSTPTRCRSYPARPRASRRAENCRRALGPRAAPTPCSPRPRSCAFMTLPKGTTIHARGLSVGLSRRALDATTALRQGGGVPSGHWACARAATAARTTETSSRGNRGRRMDRGAREGYGATIPCA